MRTVSLWPDDDLRTCFLVASGDAGGPGLRLNRGVCVWGIRPRRSRWQLGDLAGEHGEPGLVGVGGRQGNLDAGDHLCRVAGWAACPRPGDRAARREAV